MSNIKLEMKYTGIDIKRIMEYAKKVEEIHKELRENAQKKDEFLGWINLPSNHDKQEVEKREWTRIYSCTDFCFEWCETVCLQRNHGTCKPR